MYYGPIPMHKKFGSKTYTLAVARVSKGTATSMAKDMRKHGFKARVVEQHGHKYSVYTWPTMITT